MTTRTHATRLPEPLSADLEALAGRRRTTIAALLREGAELVLARDRAEAPGLPADALPSDLDRLSRPTTPPPTIIFDHRYEPHGYQAAPELVEAEVRRLAAWRARGRPPVEMVQRHFGEVRPCVLIGEELDHDGRVVLRFAGLDGRNPEDLVPLAEWIACAGAGDISDCWVLDPQGSSIVARTEALAVALEEHIEALQPGEAD